MANIEDTKTLKSAINKQNSIRIIIVIIIIHYNFKIQTKHCTIKTWINQIAIHANKKKNKYKIC